MSTATEQLEELQKLQELQNTQLFEKRFAMLEKHVEHLTQTINTIKATMAQMQMDFYRDHVRLQDSTNQ